MASLPIVEWRDQKSIFQALSQKDCSPLSRTFLQAGPFPTTDGPHQIRVALERGCCEPLKMFFLYCFEINI